MDAKALSQELAPKMASILESKKADIVDGAGGWMARKGVEAGWPIFIREVPHLLESGIELLAWKFGKMTMEDVMDLLVKVREKSPQTGTLFDGGDGGGNHSNVWMDAKP